MTPERRLQLLSASGLGRAVLGRPVEFYDPEQQRGANGQWGGGPPAPPPVPVSPSDDPQKWALKTAARKGKAGEPVLVKGGYSYEFFPMKNEPGIYGDLNVFDADRNVVASLFFGHNDRGDLEGAVEVAPAHRRKGIATEMYKLGEKLSGHTFKPAPKHTAAAEAFWQQKDRPFGVQAPAAGFSDQPRDDHGRFAPIGDAKIVPDGKDDGGHFVVRGGEKIYAPEVKEEYKKIPVGHKWLDIDKNVVEEKKPPVGYAPRPLAPAKVATLDALKGRVKAGYAKWLKAEGIEKADADHRDLDQYLEDAHGIRTRDDGRIEFDRLTANVKKIVGDLPVVLNHHTTDALHDDIAARGLLPSREVGKLSNPYKNGKRGVYVTAEGSGPVVTGYLNNAVSAHGGHPRTYEIETTIPELAPDRDDADLGLADRQFILPRVHPSKILNLREN